jgi:hypothetical protein
MSSEQALVFRYLPCHRPRRRPGLANTPVLALKLARLTHGPNPNSRSKIILLLLLSAFHLGTQPRPPCQPSPRSRRSCGRNVRTLQHPATTRSMRSGPTSQPPMNSSSYQVIRTKFTLFLTPKTFIASVTFLTLLAHPTVQLTNAIPVKFLSPQPPLAGSSELSLDFLTTTK